MLLPLAAPPERATLPLPPSVFVPLAPVAVPLAPVAGFVPLPAGSFALALVSGALVAPLPLDPQAVARRATTKADIPTSNLKRMTFIWPSHYCMQAAFTAARSSQSARWRSVALALNCSCFLLSVKGQPLTDDSALQMTSTLRALTRFRRANIADLSTHERPAYTFAFSEQPRALAALMQHSTPTRQRLSQNRNDE
jgi:hypothetical protein